ncbi:MAG: hypothetical protein GWN84_07470 [Gammaproteobacteria bacterium]|nr:hypothetical protein [Gammaproteobacteria bacterium]NIR82721.1 hypothetical protein [Gammaproteobacteria bacterium]NIR89585.1 hypothetical protein [Gammaproteobacteria bacterium]NIU03881.1 hypothetical protein [Gammaproteobacteria bacterium]NIV51197.1 hypothetical protein [Gammaproteobacteria bacterium]
MGFLDELKQEAEAAKAGEASQNGDAQERERVFRTALEPAMRRIHAYLEQVVEQLNVVNLDARVAYEVEGVGRIENLCQSNYKLKVDDPARLYDFTLCYVCSREGRIRFEKRGKPASEHLRDTLRSHGLDLSYKMGVDGNAVFTLAMMVPVSFTFEADTDHKVIRLRVRNLDILGACNYSLSPDKVDDAWLEELAKRIARRPNRFDELVGNVLPDEARRRLQRELEEMQRQRARELLERAQEEAEEKKKGLLGRLRRKQD